MSPPPRLLTLILAAAGLPGCREVEEGTACLAVAEDTTECPAAEDVDKDDLYVPWTCDDMKVRSIEGEGELQDVGWDTAAYDPACCYEAVVVDLSPNSDCVIGRPWRDQGDVSKAPAVPREDWVGARRDPPMLDGERAAAWASAAAGEHASIAAFARLALELLVHGAPADLIRAVHQAGLDEIDHAERCYAQAARFGGAPVGPGPLPCAGPIDVARPLAEIAAEAVRDGCVVETLGAIVGRAAAEACADPALRDDLLAIAADEEAHAALSWRVVAWAVRSGPEVRAAVARAFREPAPKLELEAVALRSGVPVERLRAAAGAGLAEVLRPAARSLMAA